MKTGNTELRHLRYRIAVAEFRDFRRTASALHVSQPTLSHQIAQLELQIDYHLPSEAGLLTLVSLFYKSIQEGTRLPIPYREVLLTSRIMDAAFEQIGSQRMLKAEPVAR